MDTSENNAQTNTFNPYGKLVNHTVSGTGSSLNNDLTYTGREQNNGVDGLLYYRDRYYNSSMKRFISEDPIGLQGGINQYAYVEGNPMSFSDPSGDWRFGQPLPQYVVDISAGFGDGVSFGLTKKFRSYLNLNAQVSFCSDSYFYSDIAGQALGTYLYGKASLPSKLIHYTQPQYLTPIAENGLRSQMGLFGRGGYLTTLSPYAKKFSPFTQHTGDAQAFISNANAIRVLPYLVYIENASVATKTTLFGIGFGTGWVNDNVLEQ